MLTRQIVLVQLDAYLNGRLTLAGLVDWAETALMEPEVADSEDADRLLDVVAYLGAVDTRGFPLTWDVLTSFVAQLGGTLTAAIQA